MSLADISINVLIFMIQRFLLPILPISISFLNIGDYTTYLANVKLNLISSLSGIGFFLPINLILALFLVVIFAEISLFLFKIGLFLINVFRGSGA